MKKLAMILAAAMLLSVGLWSCEKDSDNHNSTSGDNNGGGGGQVPAGWVDLGLPSGLLWAECNVGASSPEEYGNYYAWGETTTKNVYNWETYRHINSDYNQLTKYCTNSNYGVVDNLTILQRGDDAATANLGNGARTPTADEWRELISHTSSMWTTNNGVPGRMFTASNGKSLFLPAAGGRWNVESGDVGGGGYYWSSSLDADAQFYAYGLYFNSSGQMVYSASSYRYSGRSIRAVRSSRKCQ